MKHLIKYLKVELKKHLFDYLILLTAGVFFLMGLSLFKGEKLMEFLIIFAFTSLYIIWGIYHHIIENTLHLKAVIEYILIAFTLIFLMKIIIFP
ncbi:MAG: hypothetical protein HYW86_01315 [Candidatus Roizmanbacteria bacterium]|nr:MAG: hypothetical protein HYW86_01315 [Candidatus Roizmanbacteria bacterium]